MRREERERETESTHKAIPCRIFKKTPKPEKKQKTRKKEESSHWGRADGGAESETSRDRVQVGVPMQGREREVHGGVEAAPASSMGPSDSLVPRIHRSDGAGGRGVVWKRTKERRRRRGRERGGGGRGKGRDQYVSVESSHSSCC